MCSVLPLSAVAGSPVVVGRCQCLCFRGVPSGSSTDFGKPGTSRELISSEASQDAVLGLLSADHLGNLSEHRLPRLPSSLLPRVWGEAAASTPATAGQTVRLQSLGPAVGCALPAAEHTHSSE